MVELVAAGHSTKEIASRLYISDYTVQDHLKKIFAKMGINSRRELMAMLFHQGSPVSPQRPAP
jgi:DNA-binding CsgD family transcriptional regulator